jgi:hypothetical protein
MHRKIVSKTNKRFSLLNKKDSLIKPSVDLDEDKEKTYNQARKMKEKGMLL